MGKDSGVEKMKSKITYTWEKSQEGIALTVMHRENYAPTYNPTQKPEFQLLSKIDELLKSTIHNANLAAELLKENERLKDSYAEGLKQGWFDGKMDNQQLRSALREAVEALIPFSQMMTVDDFDIMWCQKAKTTLAKLKPLTEGK